MTQARAILRNIRIAPRKVRHVSSVIRGMSTNEAIAQLMFERSRSAEPLVKLIKSAIANAKAKSMNPDKLFIETIFVDKGRVLKRHLPRAMGRATLIEKKMSHVTIVLAEKDGQTVRFAFHEKPKGKKQRRSRDASPKPKTKEGETQSKIEKQPGFLQKMFRRKAV